jgi:heme exporter protein D
MANYNLFVWIAALLILISGLAHKTNLSVLAHKHDMDRNVTVVAKTN